MKIFLKNLSYIFILFILVLTFGCAKKEDKTVIKFSSWGSETEISLLKPILKEFENKNPDIKLEFIHIPKNYFQKLHLLIASNLTPDVIFLNNLNGPIYTENNVLLDLKPLMKKDNSISEKTFFPRAIEAFKYKNTIYAIPRDISNLVIYYNKDLFDKYNVSYPKDHWTFSDFLKTAKSLTKDFNNDGKIDIYGFGFETMPLFWTPFLWSNGGGIISSDLKQIEITKPETIEAIQFYSDLRNKDHIAPSASEAGSSTMAQLFMQGKLAMQINGRWSVPRYRKDIPFKWDIAKFPSGKKGSVVDCDASGWAINKSSKHINESWRLIKFLSSKEISDKMTKSGLIIPARIDVAHSDIFLEKSLSPENSHIFLDVIPQSISTPANSNYQEIIDTVNTAIEPVFNGKKQASEALNPNLKNKIQKLLE